MLRKPLAERVDVRPAETLAAGDGEVDALFFLVELGDAFLEKADLFGGIEAHAGGRDADLDMLRDISVLVARYKARRYVDVAARRGERGKISSMLRPMNVRVDGVDRVRLKVREPREVNDYIDVGHHALGFGGCEAAERLDELCVHDDDLLRHQIPDALAELCAKRPEHR